MGTLLLQWFRGISKESTFYKIKKGNIDKASLIAAIILLKRDLEKIGIGGIQVYLVILGWLQGSKIVHFWGKGLGFYDQPFLVPSQGHRVFHMWEFSEYVLTDLKVEIDVHVSLNLLKARKMHLDIKSDTENLPKVCSQKVLHILWLLEEKLKTKQNTVLKWLTLFLCAIS